MNRYKYHISFPVYKPLEVGQIVPHRHEPMVQGKISSIDKIIRVTYGRVVNGSFVEAHYLENMMDMDWIDFKDVEDVDFIFRVPKAYS